MKPNWLLLYSVFSLALLAIPIFLLIYEGFGPLRNSAGYGNLILQSIELSLLSSGITAVVCVILFTPVSYYFARNRNDLGETIADIPASIPHPIVGIAVLILVSPVTPFGALLQSIGVNIFDSILGLLIALTIVSAPIYIKSMQPFFESMNLSPENYALGLGASRTRTFLSVVIPRARKGILTASLISMSRALSEYGAIAIVAYAIFFSPTLGFFGVSPASVTLFNLYTQSGLAIVPTASAVMIVVSIALMIALRVVNRLF